MYHPQVTVISACMPEECCPWKTVRKSWLSFRQDDCPIGRPKSNRREWESCQFSIYSGINHDCWQVFQRNEQQAALTQNTVSRTVTREPQEKLMNKTSMRQVQKFYIQLKDELVLRENDLFGESEKKVTSIFMTLNSLIALNESKIHILKWHYILHLKLDCTWKVTLYLIFLITCYVGVYIWL